MCGLPGAPSGDLVGIPLIYPGRSRILHLQEFFFRLETTYCVSRTGVGVSDYCLPEIRGAYPQEPPLPQVSGCLRLCRNGAHLEGLPLSPETSTWREIRSRGELSTSRPDRGSPSPPQDSKRSRYPGTHLEDWIGVCRSPLRQNRRGGGYPK